MAERYDKEFKLHVVRQVVELNKTIVQVTRGLDISNQILSKRVQKYKEDWAEPFGGSDNLQAKDKTMQELKKQF